MNEGFIEKANNGRNGRNGRLNEGTISQANVNEGFNEGANNGKNGRLNEGTNSQARELMKK